MESLQLFRERKNLTQQWVAEQLGTHQPVISQLERGEAELSPKVATSMAHLYSVPATRLLAAHKTMQTINRTIRDIASVKDADPVETLRLASHLARIETNPNVPAALRKRAGKARDRLDVDNALVAVKQSSTELASGVTGSLERTGENLDPEIAATGLRVAQDGDGNYYIVDTSTDPPTITPVQFGDLVQQQGQPLGSKSASKSTSRRDAWGRGNRNNE